MTPDEYREAIATLGLSQNEAGRFFGVNDVTARRWAVDGPSPPVALLLKLMLHSRPKLTARDVDRIVGRESGR